MRDLIPRPLHPRPRLSVAAVPTAVVGSIALSMGWAPTAAAAEPAHTHRTPSDATVATLGPMRVQAPLAPAPPAAHTVALGDTVSRIAAAHGLRTADLLAWNGLDWGSIIRPGDVLRLTGAPAPAAAAAPAIAPPAGSHTVQAGETPWSIADRTGTSVPALLAANGLGDGAVIFPGQILQIPGEAATAAAPAASAASVAPVPIAAATHTVSAGETVSAIAAGHGLGLDAVLSANGLDRGSIIYPGQTLVIPGGATATAALSAPAPTAAGLDEEQIHNARIIIQVGRERGVPDRGIAIALATAMVESWIRNLDWGDRDSLGLFQQRPSTGWGSPEQVLDPATAAALFYGGPADPNGDATRGLLDVPGWESMRFTDAAQAVQVSAFPDRYGEWEQQAYAWLAALG